MSISVVGTGEVASAVATKLNALDHHTVFGSRHPGSDRDGIPVLSHADAAAHGDWIVNALHGENAMATLVPLDLAGKLLVDIGNWPPPSTARSWKRWVNRCSAVCPTRLRSRP